MAFSKTVSEDIMHVSLIFELGSTFHKKKKKQNKTKKRAKKIRPHCEILGGDFMGLLCVGKGSAVKQQLI